MKHLTTAVISAWALPVLAHEGHGLLGAHWHATDALGFVGMVALIGIAVWMTRK